jgi:uncharacterized protein (TIGR02246 family)
MRTCAVLLVAAAVLAAGQIVATGTQAGKPDDAKAKADAAPGKGKRAQEFIAAFEAGDAKALAGFWTPEGDYVDDTGRQYKGRAAIEKMYATEFAGRKGMKLAVTVTSARMIGNDVVLEEGITEVTPPNGGPPTAGHFTAVLVRKDGVWYFENVRETVATPPTHAQHFDDMAWLIGDWAGEAAGKGESATASYDWEENGNFIVCDFATTLNGVPVIGGTQWIGWDAIDKRVRSWSFYSGGGFGEGAWTVDGGKITVKTTARTADGRSVSVVNVMTKVDDDTLLWQATQLTVDGKQMPDGPAQKMKRQKAGAP